MRKTARKRKDKKRQIFGIIIFTVSFLLIAGVLTGSKYLGELGEYIHLYFLEYTFGYSILIIPFLLICYGWYIFFRKPISSLLKLSSYLLILMLVISLSLSVINILFTGKLGDASSIGGVAGIFLVNRSQQYLGTIGSIVVLISVYLIYVFFLFDIELSDKYHFVEEKIKKLFSKIKTVIKREKFKKKR